MALSLEDKIHKLITKLERKNWDIEEGDFYAIVYESEYPYLFIEFTELIDEPWDEEFYTEMHNQFLTSFFARTDGTRTKIYSYFFGHGLYFNDVNSIEEFLEIPAVELYPYDIFRRIEEIEMLREDRVVHQFIEGAIISKYSDSSWQRRYSELANALFYEGYDPTNRHLPIIIEDDAMLEYQSVRTPTGDTYKGIHRKLIATLPNDKRMTFIISMFATDKVIKSAKENGATQLNVAIVEDEKPFYNLQINLDKFTKQIGNHYVIWHSDVRSKLKNDFILKTVRKKAPFLIQDNQIILGKFLLDGYLDSIDLSNFVENLITYSYCRKLADLQFRK